MFEVLGNILIAWEFAKLVITIVRFLIKVIRRYRGR